MLSCAADISLRNRNHKRYRRLKNSRDRLERFGCFLNSFIFTLTGSNRRPLHCCRMLSIKSQRLAEELPLLSGLRLHHCRSRLHSQQYEQEHRDYCAIYPLYWLVSGDLPALLPRAQVGLRLSFQPARLRGRPLLLLPDLQAPGWHVPRESPRQPDLWALPPLEGV